jgi:hypothetical protein
MQKAQPYLISNLVLEVGVYRRDVWIERRDQILTFEQHLAAFHGGLLAAQELTTGAWGQDGQ